MSSRRCAARRSPGRAATPRRASSRPAWRRSWSAIAGIYRTSEVALPPEIAGKAVQISLHDKSLVMDPIAS